ncbi:MAG: hypothetical protein OEV44_06500 [Spirochaetota bacterium]|nr:hypothetical protein [Spirochaetota bacterium]
MKGQKLKFLGLVILSLSISNVLFAWHGPSITEIYFYLVLPIFVGYFLGGGIVGGALISKIHKLNIKVTIFYIFISFLISSVIIYISILFLLSLKSDINNILFNIIMLVFIFLVLVLIEWYFLFRAMKEQISRKKRSFITSLIANSISYPIAVAVFILFID